MRTYTVGFKSNTNFMHPLQYRRLSTSGLVREDLPGLVWEFTTEQPAELEAALKTDVCVEIIIRPVGLPLFN